MTISKIWNVHFSQEGQKGVYHAAMGDRCPLASTARKDAAMSTREIERWHKSERQAERQAYNEPVKSAWERYQELRAIEGRYWTEEEAEEFEALQEMFSLREV